MFVSRSIKVIENIFLLREFAIVSVFVCCKIKIAKFVYLLVKGVNSYNQHNCVLLSSGFYRKTQITRN